MEEKEVVNGAILELDDRDWIAGWEDVSLDGLPTIKTPDNEYNQNEFASEYGYCLCTLYRAIWVVADNCWISFNETQRKELAKLRYNSYDFKPEVGGYIAEWLNIVRKYTAKDLAQYRFSVTDSIFNTLLDKWYRINIWISVWETYLKDRQDNWQLDQVSFGKTKYWHSTTIKKDGANYIIDNYKWKYKWNKIKVGKLQELIDGKIIFPYAYIITNKNMQDVPSEVLAQQILEIKDISDVPASKKEMAIMLWRLIKRLDKKWITLN